MIDGRSHDLTPAKRIVLFLALLIVLALTVSISLAAALRTRAPEVASHLWPGNARAAGQAAQTVIIAAPRERARAVRFAQQALRRDPTIIAAVVTMGIASELAGQRDRSRQYFSYAEWLSRRNLPTELWWIEDAVARGDVPAALRHYDIALRANRHAPDVLFPIMGGAVSQLEVRRELAALLARDPPWGTRFFRWLIGNGINNRSAVLLVTDVQRRGRRIAPELLGQLEQGLLDQRDYDTAWLLYRNRHPAARRDRSRDDRFAAVASRQESPFDWNVVPDQGGAAFSRVGDRAVLAFSTVPTEGGLLARQFQLLPSGTYRLRAETSLESGTSASRPYWLLRCVDGRDLGRAPLGNGAAGPATLQVPPDCPAQWLALAADAGDGVEGSAGTVRSVSLAPME